MSVKAQIADLLNLIPEADLQTVLEVVRHFVPVISPDDIASTDDFAAHDAAMLEYASGEAVPHDAIDWD